MATNPTFNPLLSKEADELAAKIAQEADERDALTKQAMSNPFPGSSGDVFAVPPTVKIGKWDVRQFYDLDVEILKHLKHPLYRDMESGMRGDKVPSEFTGRGPDAWTFCWLLTRPPDEAELLLTDTETAKKAARREFGVLRLPALFTMVNACTQSMALYSTTALSYGPGNQKGSDDGENPPEAR